MTALHSICWLLINGTVIIARERERQKKRPFSLPLIQIVNKLPVISNSEMQDNNNRVTPDKPHKIEHCEING